MSNFENLLKQHNIFFSWKVDDKGNIVYPESRGPEKLKLFSIIKIKTLAPKMKNAHQIQKIWDDFMDIVNILSKNEFLTAELENLRLRINNWITHFLSIYQTRDTTPYIHLLTHHCTDIIENHGSVAMFNTQGLERMNDIVSKMYFRSTNQSKDSLQQLILKHKRIEYFEDESVPRKRRRYICSVCGGEGHSRSVHSD